jgi:hypothetical protein
MIHGSGILHSAHSELAAEAGDVRPTATQTTTKATTLDGRQNWRTFVMTFSFS